MSHEVNIVKSFLTKSHKANIVKSFLLRWIILHGDNWVWHVDAYEDNFIAFDIAKGKKYIEEEDQFPTDKLRWGSYYKLTKKGRKYATMR
jgi:hypothetical protein